MNHRIDLSQPHIINKSIAGNKRSGDGRLRSATVSILTPGVTFDTGVTMDSSAYIFQLNVAHRAKNSAVSHTINF